MWWLRFAAAIAFLAAMFVAFGWLLDQSVSRALGLVCLGLLSWVVSTFPSPVVPPSR
jgi:hypothetical protein